MSASGKGALTARKNVRTLSANITSPRLSTLLWHLIPRLPTCSYTLPKQGVGSCSNFSGLRLIITSAILFGPHWANRRNVHPLYYPHRHGSLHSTTIFSHGASADPHNIVTRLRANAGLAMRSNLLKPGTFLSRLTDAKLPPRYHRVTTLLLSPLFLWMVPTSLGGDCTVQAVSFKVFRSTTYWTPHTNTRSQYMTILCGSNFRRS